MKISVIIPALNEEKAIARTLEDLCSRHHPDEVILVDGGSRDQTVNLSTPWAKVISSDKGRAHQMNTGAQSASGDVFLFLHADTLLPPGGLESIRAQMATGYQAGRFRLRFDEPKFLLQLFSSYTRFHCFSYGDQVFFVTRRLFEELNGYSENVPFEDVDFYKRLRQLTKPVIIRDPVTTSARRFSANGCLRQKWINLYLMALYYAGVDVLSLKKSIYPDLR